MKIIKRNGEVLWVDDRRYGRYRRRIAHIMFSVRRDEAPAIISGEGNSYWYRSERDYVGRPERNDKDPNLHAFLGPNGNTDPVVPRGTMS